MSLFRKEAMEFRKVKLHGEILITNPLSMTVLTTISCVIAFLLVSYLVWGEYTQKQRVKGFLVPDKGLIRVYATQQGTIIKLHVTEGEHVEKGQLLYTQNSEKVSGSGVSTQSAIIDNLLSREESFEEERERIIALHASTLKKSQTQLTAYQEERHQLKAHEGIILEQIALLEDNLARYESIAKEGYVSKLQVDEKKKELLNTKSTHRQIIRQQLVLARDIQALEESIKTAELRRENDLATLDRNKLSTQQSLLENDTRREVAITAPISGIVTGIIAKPGQTVGTGSLLSILPDGSELQAELYAPSQAISFIAPGSDVLLRYVAFPYQKFGQHQGKVVNVSRVALSGKDLQEIIATPVGQQAQFYRITVSLPNQNILAYGNPEPLQAGMDVEADILIDTRKLYEWLFEPLYSISGKI